MLAWLKQKTVGASGINELYPPVGHAEAAALVAAAVSDRVMYLG